MSALGAIYMKKETLSKLVEVLNQRGENGIEITLSISDETNQYGQNVTGFVSQTKEQREEKKPKIYVGNGKVFWTDGTIKVAEKKTESVQGADVVEPESDDFPF